MSGAPAPSFSIGQIREAVRSAGIAAVAQLAEHVICNLEVAGSIPVGGFRNTS